VPATVPHTAVYQPPSRTGPRYTLYPTTGGRIGGGWGGAASDFAVDGRVPFARFASVIAPIDGERPATLLAMPDPPIDRDGLGDVGALLGSPEYAYDVLVVPKRTVTAITGPSGIPAAPMKLDVFLEEPPQARVRDAQGVELVMALGADEEADERRGRLGGFQGPVSRLRVVPRATDTMQRVVRVVAALSDPAARPASFAMPPAIELAPVEVLPPPPPRAPFGLPRQDFRVR
jgi:hypothetical protein